MIGQINYSNVNSKGNVVVQSPSDNLRASQKLSTLSSGDTINAKVTGTATDENGGKIATIDLGNNTYVTARLQNGMTLSDGQSIAFQVKSTSDGSITLTPLFTNTASFSSAEKALSAAGLETNAANLQMVHEMMEQGMSIDTTSVMKMYSNISGYSTNDISNIVTMSKLGIPISQQNLEQITNYQNYEHQIIDGVNEVINNIPNAYSELAADNQFAANNMYGDLMKLFAQPFESLNGSFSSTVDNLATMINGNMFEANSFSMENLKNIFSSLGTQELNTLIDKLSPEAKNALIEGGILDDNGQILSVNKDLSNNKDASINLNDDTFGKSDIQNSTNSNLILNNTVFSKNFVSLLKNIGIPDSMILGAVIGDSEGTLSDLGALSKNNILSTLSDIYENADAQTKNSEAFSKLFSSSDFTNLLKDIISNGWTLKPEEIFEKRNIEELYSKLGEQTKALSQLLEANGLSTSKASVGANNLSSNVDFMNQLNNMYAYVQLPLKLSKSEAHGDLYVYSNKKNLSKKDGEISAIMHLDMQNLGPVDVYVKMNDMKVNTRFVLSNEAAIDLFASHIDELDKRLEDRGYSMQSTITSADEENDKNPVLDAMLGDSKKQILLSDISFDAKA